jgi:hypothetical protein
MPADPTLANAEAYNVSVTWFALAPVAGAIGLADHFAVTPAGNPLTASPMLPLNGPPVAAVKLTVLDAPRATAIELAAAVKVSVGGAATVSA